MKIIVPFQVAQRQLLRHDSLRNLWTHIWILTQETRSQPRSRLPGPLSVLQSVANEIHWEWTSPFEFKFKLPLNHSLQVNILSLDPQYFSHLVRLGTSMHLWKRASQRKNLHGIQNGADKTSTLGLLHSKSLSEYDKGVLRAVFADAISTQQQLFTNKTVAHPICHYCWLGPETTEHLFWTCPAIFSS